MSAKISIIVSLDDKRGIGAHNRLLFRIKKDLQRFKKITWGHPIIMGRKTYQSISRPLPGRINIIITSDHDFSAPGCLIADSLDKAVFLALKKDPRQIFIIGGGQVFSQALAKGLVTDLYLTKVKGDYQAEIFFPDYSAFSKVTYSQQDQEGDYQFEFVNLTK